MDDDDDDDDDDDALLTSALTVSSSHGVDEVLSTVREIDTELLSKVMRRGESEDEEEDEDDDDNNDDDDAVATTDSETECRGSNWDIFVLNSIRSVKSAKSSSNTVTIREVIIALLRSHK